AATGWNVYVHHFPPLHADWDPRVGPGTLPALALAALAACFAVSAAESLSWRRLLAAAFVGGLAWMFALAFVDGPGGIGHILTTPYEYLRTAHRIDDVGRLLREYVSRIPYSAAPRNWTVHVAGHPPGALLFFVALVRLGLGSGFAAGAVVTLAAASTAVAVLTCVRALGGEGAARRAAPFLVFGPAAVWQAVSADAMFAAVAAWGLAALAVAATTGRGCRGLRGGLRSVAFAVVGGLLLGYAVMLSYGLPLLGLLVVAVLWLGGSWRPLPVAAFAAAAVVGVFAALGFSYPAALSALHERYWAGVAGRRPWTYWIWGDLAALSCSAGPLLGAGLGSLVARGRGALRHASTRVAATLAGTAAISVLVADASQMSKAEVERIWLPFLPWLLLCCGLLPERWRRRGLVLQLAVALLLEHLLATGW
ncbi:MAG TPA: hypothetical protein VGI54_02915, partial [Solirubrobacteraceae bacterium]